MECIKALIKILIFDNLISIWELITAKNGNIELIVNNSDNPLSKKEQ